MKGGAIHCPFHEDRTPSGGVYEKEGHWRYKCFSCGFLGDVRDVLGHSGGAMTKPTEPMQIFESVDAIRRAHKSAEAVYCYTSPHAKGKIDLVVVRSKKNGHKTFTMYAPGGNGFVAGAPVKPWPLYNRLRCLHADEVVVVEGEKCVHALHKVGIVATTKPCGAQSPEAADWAILRAKTVFLWPDNDKKGISYMQKVRALLEPMCKVCWIEPEELGLDEKGDAADMIAELGVERGKKVIRDLLYATKPRLPAADVKDILDQTIEGKIRAIRLPWDGLTQSSKALMPKTLTLVCGAAAGGKSLFVSEAMIYWHDQNIPWAVYEMEEDRNYHLIRALAQRAYKADLLDDVWVRENPEEVRKIYTDNADWLNDFGKHIWSAPDREATLDELLNWAELRARENYRVVIIDPITAAATTARPWEADKGFLFSAKVMVRKYGISLVLVTHPKKGAKQTIGIDVLAGGAAYARFTQTVIWLEHIYPSQEVYCTCSAGTSPVEINRKVHIAKARNGSGHGASLGFTFDHDQLRFIEHGEIKGKVKGIKE